MTFICLEIQQQFCCFGACLPLSDLDAHVQSLMDNAEHLKLQFRTVC